MERQVVCAHLQEIDHEGNRFITTLIHADKLPTFSAVLSRSDGTGYFGQQSSWNIDLSCLLTAQFGNVYGG